VVEEGREEARGASCSAGGTKTRTWSRHGNTKGPLWRGAAATDGGSDEREMGTRDWTFHIWNWMFFVVVTIFSFYEHFSLVLVADLNMTDIFTIFGYF
jgi:hypothetical protein